MEIGYGKPKFIRYCIIAVFGMAVMWIERIGFGLDGNWIFGPDIHTEQMTLQQIGSWITVLLPFLFLSIMWIDSWMQLGCMAMLRFKTALRWWIRIEAENSLTCAVYLFLLLATSRTGGTAWKNAGCFCVLFIHLLLLEHLIIFLKLHGTDTVYALTGVIIAEGTGIFILSGENAAVKLFPGYWGIWNYCSFVRENGYDIQIVILIQLIAISLILYFTIRKNCMEILLK